MPDEVDDLILKMQHLEAQARASQSSRRLDSPIIRQICDCVELGKDVPRTST